MGLIKLGKFVLVGGAVTALGAGCLTRPVSQQEPTTKVSFTTTVKQAAVDKIDLLLVIDNSRSMGDKQAILSEAVPDLINSLVTPNCVDDEGKPTGDRADSAAEEGKECARGKAEFKPIVDIHVGVVSSAMGGFGSDSCGSDAQNPTDATLNSHNNDQGRLINRSGAKETPIGNAAPSNFLSWFPSVKRNETKTPSTGSTPYKVLNDFNGAFSGLISGVKEYGCGFEASLESWYHFLVQPDPYEKIVRDGNAAKYDGIDQTILQQRADFLRPDSLVAIVLLTDEEDSGVDPLALGAQGWAFMNTAFPASTGVAGAQRDPNRGGSTAPKGTTACDTDPGSPDCTSCGFKSEATKNDPKCKDNEGFYAKNDDDMNVRFHKMKQRFGVDPQYPIKRYVDGLTKTQIPDRVTEHDVNGNYIGTGKCRNPLFSKNLPKSAVDANDPALCNLEKGPRAPDLVFFAVVGGVPQDLLHFDANNVEKSKISEEDWVKIIGRDPEKYNFEGMDSRMDESVKPRTGRPTPSTTPGDNFDSSNKLRDWDTKNQDLQYACTFPLAADVQCGAANKEVCDCDGAKNPPLCKAATTQSRAKAYPTQRQFRVVHALKDQGIISSLCPLTVGEGAAEKQEAKEVDGKPNPRYGYRPAVKSIVDRLKNALANQCLPQKLTRDDKGQVSCLILETLPNKGDKCSTYSLTDPAPEILAKFREKQKEQKADTSLTVCQATQLVKPAGETCSRDTAAGWCYVENTATSKVIGACSQAIVFSPTGNPPVGALTDLQCIQQFGGESATADGGK